MDYYAPSSMLVVGGFTYDGSIRGDSTISTSMPLIYLYTSYVYTWGLSLTGWNNYWVGGVTFSYDGSLVVAVLGWAQTSGALNSGIAVLSSSSGHLLNAMTYPNSENNYNY